MAQSQGTAQDNMAQGSGAGHRLQAEEPTQMMQLGDPEVHIDIMMATEDTIKEMVQTVHT